MGARPTVRTLFEEAWDLDRQARELILAPAATRIELVEVSEKLASTQAELAVLDDSARQSARLLVSSAALFVMLVAVVAALIFGGAL